MTTRVVTVEMDDSLESVHEIFCNVKFHHLLVENEKQLVGIISDRDLLKAISPNINTLSETTRDRATLNKRAHQIMTRNPISIQRDRNLEEAAQLLVEKRISCLPVIDSDKHIEGLVTWIDIVKAFLSQNLMASLPHLLHA